MGFSLSALGRSKGLTRPRTTASAEGVYTTVEQLVALEATARDFNFLRKQPVNRLLAGRHASNMRGRGLSFEELRDYLPGDDVRAIDWRVTARTDKPFVRVYDEEKDRPALIVVDQRMNMFFGSRLMMKSVSAAETAALCAWRVMNLGDRVGGFVFNDTRIDELRPHRSRAAVIELAGAIAKQNAELKADLSDHRGSGQLDLALEAVANVARHDHLVVVISDFEGHGPRTRDLLLRLTISNDVLAVLVYDPFLLDLIRQSTAQQVTITEAISQSVANSALDLDAKAIITPTESGYTARMVSKYRPKSAILAVTPNEQVMRRLCLIWGVVPIKGEEARNTDEMFQLAVDNSMKAGHIRLGDLVIITAGVPVGRSGSTNLMKVHHVGELIAKGQGIGSRLVDALMEEAKALGIPKVMALT